MTAASYQIVNTGGRLPPFWDREVVFFANLLALFFGNEEETSNLAREVGEVDCYGGRLLPILNLLYKGEGNLLVLERSPGEALPAYFRDELGLRLPKIEVMSHRRYEELRGHFAQRNHEEAARILAAAQRQPAGWVDGYVTDEILAGIGSFLGKKTITTVDGSHLGNNKLLLLRFLQEAGLPVIQTELAEAPADVSECVRRLRESGFEEAVLKSQIGASGIGLVKLPGIAETGWTCPQGLGHLFYEGPCMVQGWLKPGLMGVRQVRSPSVQFFLHDDAGYLFDITEQILSQHSVHEGNESPPPYFDLMPELGEELFRQSTLACEWLYGQGYRGTGSVDFLVVERDQSENAREAYICEINARVTGATYPSVLARHFAPEDAWLLRNLRLQEPVEESDVLEMLRRPNHLFTPEKGRGILPVNFNFGPSGGVLKGQFLCLGETPERCHRYLELAQMDMPAQWVFDRD